ncbi:MAG: pyridine nucleotide-disulfide oxidoreductase [Rhodoferax sp.]|nr:pyridine nucleotide-disulfide oxidoreductase [Rhodoferax sp.]
MNAIDSSAPPQRILIAGAGQAALQTAEALRAAGHTGEIHLYGDEAHAPYHRPPLSKAWLAGEMEAAQLTMRSAEQFERKSIVLHTRARVSAIDRAARQLQLADGRRVAYDALVLATGATPRNLPLPGAALPGVLTLRSRDDADALAQGLADCAASARPLVIIGGGFIGLEIAATARRKGVAVCVVEAAPRLLGRVLTPLLSDWYAQLHRSHGVELLLGAQVQGIEAGPDGAAAAVRLADRLLPAGRVVVGIGVSANDALAREAGLDCDRGIVVDACGRTADPAIFAAGDCTARRLANGSLLRLESVQNATEQGKSAAAAILGQERPFSATPWFWSDQYDRKLQMAGLSAGASQSVLRGSLDAGSFNLYHFQGDRLLAVDSVNASRDHLLARKLLDAGVSPTPGQAADAGFDLNRLLLPAG